MTFCASNIASPLKHEHREPQPAHGAREVKIVGFALSQGVELGEKRGLTGAGSDDLITRLATLEEQEHRD